jgi:eukaryotic-like serine/threonine-protein kinase
MPESRQGGGAGAAKAEPNRSEPGKGEPDPLLGRTINGRFKIVSVIARGGMGKVYRAEQAPLGRICALKVLSPKYEGDRDPEFHKRFFLEAATAAKLTHPNTVTVFDYGQSDDIYFIAMEYIEGRTLHRVLREEGPFAEERAAHIASQICRSLREAHGQGVVHRDLKPGNILLSERDGENDNVKVLDFGLVKDVSGEAEDLTQAGLFMGSPKYMAPEQILGGEISAKTDIYSLGVLMYEMLTGKVPFDRGASVGTLMAHVNEAPPDMRTQNPNIALSATMEQVVLRCLEKDPAKRFASMKDLLNGLKRIGANGSAMTDTSESLPLARLDSGAISIGRVIPEPQATPSGLLGMTPSGVLSPESSRRVQPLFASPSITDMLSTGSSPPEADLGARPAKGRGYIWGLVAAGVAVGIGAMVFITSSKPPPSDPLAETGKPVVAAPPDPTPVVTAPPAVSSASATSLVRKVHVESDPAGATVSENGTDLCAQTPCDLTFTDDAAKGEHKLSFSKKGYKSSKITLGVSDDKASSKLDLQVFVPVQHPQPPPGPSVGPDGKLAPKPSPY